MSYRGDFKLGTTVYMKFCTVTTTGAPTQLAGTPVVSVYEQNNTTQITAGVTLTVDYDSVTGLNDVAIVASGANGYEVGKQYDVVITTGTVGGTSVVGYVVGSFSIEKTGLNVSNTTISDGGAPVFGIVESGTAQGGTASTIQLRSGANFTADDRPNGMYVIITGGTGAGQARSITDYVNSTDTATVSPDWLTNPSSDSTYLVVATPPAVTSGTLPAVEVRQVGGTSQTPGDLAALITTVDTVVDRIEVDTQDLQTQVGTDGAGLTNIPWNASWDAQVESEVVDALGTCGINPTDGIDRIAGVNLTTSGTGTASIGGA